MSETTEKSNYGVVTEKPKYGVAIIAILLVLTLTPLATMCYYARTGWVTKQTMVPVKARISRVEKSTRDVKTTDGRRRTETIKTGYVDYDFKDVSVRGAYYGDLRGSGGGEVGDGIEVWVDPKDPTKFNHAPISPLYLACLLIPAAVCAALLWSYLSNVRRKRREWFEKQLGGGGNES
jgi:hypothetical protein